VLVAAAALAGTQAAEAMSWLWLAGYFVIVTLGELYLSPIGLSLVTKVAPTRYLSMTMGVWLATSFAGNFIAGWLGSFWSSMEKRDFFFIVGLIAAGAGLAIWGLERFMRRVEPVAMATGYPANRTSNSGERVQDDLRTLCASLRNQLGPFGYQWLCACAVFPVLRLALTVHLGNQLAKAVGRISPNERELLSICRLPWFRKAWMPDELRVHLIQDIAAPFNKTVRRAIEHFLYAGLDGRSASAISLDELTPPRNWRPLLNSWVSIAAASSGRDELFTSFMKAQKPASVRPLESHLLTPIGGRFRGTIDLRAVGSFLLAASVSFGLWFYSEDIAAALRGYVVSALGQLDAKPSEEHCLTPLQIASRAVKTEEGDAYFVSCVYKEPNAYKYFYIVSNRGVDKEISVRWNEAVLYGSIAPQHQLQAIRTSMAPPTTIEGTVFIGPTQSSASVPTVVPTTQK